MEDRCIFCGADVSDQGRWYCSKCEAMYEYGDGKYCCFDNVMRFIKYVNKYKIEIL